MKKHLAASLLCFMLLQVLRSYMLFCMFDLIIAVGFFLPASYLILVVRVPHLRYVSEITVEAYYHLLVADIVLLQFFNYSRFYFIYFLYFRHPWLSPVASHTALQGSLRESFRWLPPCVMKSGSRS